MRVDVLALALLCCACEPSSTIEVRIAPALAGASVERLTVSVFEPGGLVGRLELTSPKLPGTVNVRVKDLAQDLRIVAVATPAGNGAVQVASTPGKLVKAAIQLGSLPDSDADGVPDLVDVCPTVVDSTQASARGGAPGDACLDGGTPDGGAATDAGAADAGLATLDAGLGGPSRCPVAGAFWCEGFEGSLVGYPVQGEQGTVAIANGDAARGNGALEANVPNRTSGFAFVTVRNESAIATEDVWALRAFVFVPSMQVPTGGSILIARYSGDYSSIALGLTTTGRLELERNWGGQGATTPSTSFFPLDRWVCLELEHARANGLAQVRAFVDEVEDRSLVQTNLPVANRLDQILLGLHLPPSAAAPPARVRIDEVLLTATRQGCGR